MDSFLDKLLTGDQGCSTDGAAISNNPISLFANHLLDSSTLESTTNGGFNYDSAGVESIEIANNSSMGYSSTNHAGPSLAEVPL